MRTRRVWWLGLLVLATTACGCGSGTTGGAPFTPTTPVADPCGMIALSTVQSLVPGVTAGVPRNPDDNANSWARGCTWQGSGGMAATLLVIGALTRNEELRLGTVVEANSSATTQATAVPGLGDKAVYLVNKGLDEILNAQKGSIFVSVAAYNFTPPVPEASLQPLVVEALGKI
jgi:hypothetical protein